MAEEKINVSPDVCSFVNNKNNKLHIEISLPGVKKEDIDLKLLEDSLSLSAPRDDMQYVTTLAMCCSIVPEKAEALYQNGLLKIEAPFKDVMESAIKINVQ